LPGHAAAAIRRLTKLIPGVVEVSRSRRLVEVQAGEESWLDLYEHQVRRTLALARGGEPFQ
jgi:hypothetical protein